MISMCIIFIKMSDITSLTTGLFTMHFALLAYLKVLRVSLWLELEGEMATILIKMFITYLSIINSTLIKYCIHIYIINIL